MKSQCETSDPKEVSLLFSQALYRAFVLWLFSSFDYFVFDKVKSDIFLTVWTSLTLLASVFLKPSVISHMIIQFEGWVGDFFDHKKYHSNWFLRLKNRDFSILINNSITHDSHIRICDRCHWVAAFSIPLFSVLSLLHFHFYSNRR